MYSDSFAQKILWPSPGKQPRDRVNGVEGTEKQPSAFSINHQRIEYQPHKSFRPCAWRALGLNRFTRVKIDRVSGPATHVTDWHEWGWTGCRGQIPDACCARTGVLLSSKDGYGCLVTLVECRWRQVTKMLYTCDISLTRKRQSLSIYMFHSGGESWCLSSSSAKINTRCGCIDGFCFWFSVVIMILTRKTAIKKMTLLNVRMKLLLNLPPSKLGEEKENSCQDVYLKYRA